MVRFCPWCEKILKMRRVENTIVCNGCGYSEEMDASNRLILKFKKKITKREGYRRPESIPGIPGSGKSSLPKDTDWTTGEKRDV